MDSLLVNNYSVLEPLEAITPDLLQAFVNWLDVSPKTVATYTRALKQFFIYLSANEIKKPSYTDVIKYREYLMQGHKPATVNAYIMAVKQFFRWTECEGLYVNIAKNVKAPRLNKEHRKDNLQPKQVKKVLEVLSKAKGNGVIGIRNYAILMLLLGTGMRTVEIRRANVGDLRTIGDSTVLFVQGKGELEKTKYIKLVEEVEEALRAYLIFRGSVKSDEPLFTSYSNNSTGKRLTERSISGIVKQAYINAGFNSDRLTAHSTRHTAVTAALQGGENLEAVKYFARHKDLETTLIYAHHTDMLNNTCAETIANALFR